MYAYIQDVPIDEALYTRIRAHLGDEPLQGQLVHLVLRREDGLLRYVDVWESKEACAETFEKRIHPAVFAAFEEAKFRPTKEPTQAVADVIELVLGSAPL